jgi:hypothetical protein
LLRIQGTRPSVLTGAGRAAIGWKTALMPVPARPPEGH